ncbi:phage replication O-like protein O [Paenibacillus sp. V4I3]|uniref:replication protein n=1 Tax=Paenibacillus sp. V4I3 TaxID=3042305 RepID=UPI002786D31B|nr:replication protein [Paenibacillus sp. V4I3]MDQ0876787.1 phage replication O-like protein O [Paenibacillus sp. V4I3]
MADVQLENGYTAIANVVLEQLYQTKLNATQHRIVLAVLRFTYGFKRKSHAFSMGFLSKAVDGDRRQVQRELKKLLDRKIILESVPESTVRVLGFNKNYDEWLCEITSGKSTIDGEATSGEATTGESTINGENTMRGSGESTISSSGESTTQEINLLKQAFKENIITAQVEVSNSLIILQDAFCDLHGKIPTQLRQSDYKSMNGLIANIPTVEFIVSAMKTIFEEKRSREDDKEGVGFRIPSTFKYYEKAIDDMWKAQLAKHEVPPKVIQMGKGPSSYRSGKSSKPRIQGILPDSTPASRLSDEELAKAREKAKSLDDKLNKPVVV